MPLYAYFQGQYVPLDEAKLPIRTHAFHYGTGVFEGIRANFNQDEGQVYIFRPQDHFQRLIQSAHIIKIKVKPTVAQMVEIAQELVRRSGLKADLYIRPVAYKSEEAVANLRAHVLADDFMMFAMQMGNYLDPSKGVHCCTSSWRRVDDLSIPARAKVTGLYVNSVLAKTEAVESGFDEAIMLNNEGHVAEGTGENVFLLSGGKLVTPVSTDNVLLGITRQTVIELARKELAMETVERSVDRSEMYTADEMFLTGTAAHITPVTRVDHRQVGNGAIGAFTRQLQALYFDVVRGKNKKYIHWCTPAFVKVAKA